MTDQHRATPETWTWQERVSADGGETASCILELRARVEGLEKLHSAVVELNERFSLDPLVARVEALEAAQRPNHPEIPDSSPACTYSLVERVAAVVTNAACCDHDDAKIARAAILEVAAWLDERDLKIQNDPDCPEAPFADDAVRWLRFEANL